MAVTIDGTDGISPLKASGQTQTTTGTAASPAISSSSDTDSGIFFGTNQVNISTGGSTRATVDSSGRLLVGTSSSSAKTTSVFEGNSTIGTGDARLIMALGGNSPSDGTLLGILRYTDNSHATANTSSADISVARDGGTWTSGSSMPGRLVFSTTADGASTPTERMRVTSGGKINVNSANNTGGIMNLKSDSSTNFIFEFTHHSNNASVGSVTTSTTATAYNTSSDYRLKENVVNISDGITRVKQLAPKRFNFIVDSDTTVDGFLAHEAQTVVPEAVTGTHNEVDDDGNAVMQGIDQSKLVPLLTAALKEAITKIETLETKVAALEAAE